MSIMWLNVILPPHLLLTVPPRKSLSLPCSLYSRCTSLLIFVRHTRLLATGTACSLCLELLLFSHLVMSNSWDSSTPWTAIHQLPYPSLSPSVCSNSCPSMLGMLSPRSLHVLHNHFIYIAVQMSGLPWSSYLKQLLLPFISPPDCLIFLMVLYGTVNLLFNFVQPEGWDYLTYYFISNCQNIAWDVEECSRLVISKYLFSDWVNE